ncbi:MAG: hypothetical protein QNJ68_06580 [Microcoleaceae cyanobacterium MO_207.B10]|nr:hypothetical protein [Microcoleaceae cyanobacterium MO_207.B10]
MSRFDEVRATFFMRATQDEHLYLYCSFPKFLNLSDRGAERSSITLVNREI